MKAVIAYIPAIHQGYINFLKKVDVDCIYILDSSLVLEIPRLERDIRAVDPQNIVQMVNTLKLAPAVKVLTKEILSELDEYTRIVMPDEDVSRVFVERYLPAKTIEYETTFLRWDKNTAFFETEAPADRVISEAQRDQELMNTAFAEAEKSSDWWRQIGSLIVKDGKVILLGHNHPLPSDQVHNIFGDPRSNFDYGVSFELSKFIHGEAGIIAEAAKRGISLEGTSIYVTTFPCPVCAKSIAASGIKKVYYAKGYSLLDAEDVLKSFGIEIVLVK